MAPVRTTCPYCGVGCGVLATPRADGGVAIAGDPHHPANFGRLCSKGTALGETMGPEGRLLHPEIDGRRVDWDQALNEVARGLLDAIATHGPDSVAFYVSGQLLTEDYYVANKLMKGFIGSANIDTNSRLCMASAVAAHKRAFGTDTVPCSYEDLEQADLVVLVGSNLAWCHPVLFQRLMAAKAARPELVVVAIDPRRTVTAEAADLHLAIAPGMDGLLFAGLLAFLDEEGWTAQHYLRDHTEGFDAALAAARHAAPSIEAAARGCVLAVDDVVRFYGLFAGTRRTVTLFSQGINQSSSGTDKANAIINVHLATGRIGRPGMGPFSITGQPNAMGGREVGGLANQLAARVEFDDAAGADIVRAFWRSPGLADKPGLKAVELFEAVADGRIKALWIMGTNPAVSLPDADRVRAALTRCPLVVISDCVRETDTVALAHIRLPAAGWGEKDGSVTNSERRISRQRAFRAPPGEARPDWWMVSEVGRRMGFARAFSYRSAVEIFREHAALSGMVGRDFDIAAFAGLSEQDYRQLEPVLWPVGDPRRPFSNDRFFTPDGRARLVPIRPRPPHARADAAFPLLLNTGRYRDHWHTLTRTGLAPTLSRHRVEPMLDLHPDDAAAAAVRDNDLVAVESAHGRALLRARIEPGQTRGTLFAPMHWSASWTAAGRIDALVAPVTDPVSGQPESKATAVRVSRIAVAWQGFALSRTPIATEGLLYWTRRRVPEGWLYELAGDRAPADWRRWMEARFPTAAGDWLVYEDPARSGFRSIRIEQARVVAGLLIGDALPREWLAARLSEPLTGSDHRALLAGQLPGRDPGPLVCACFGTHQEDILSAIAGGADCVDAIGGAVRAGSNCGSCRPELAALLRPARAA